jgi:putative transposase
MARLPRLILAGMPHLITQRGHDGAAIVRDDEDRRRWVALLRDAVATHDLDLHAWSLKDDRFDLILTPPHPQALSRAMQSLARRHAASFNRRHGRRGTLWESRFSVALVQPGAWLTDTMLQVECACSSDVSASRREPAWSSLSHHLGRQRDPVIVEATVWWSLGNTPFEREAAWMRRLEQGLPQDRISAIESALRRGLPLGEKAFIDEIQPHCDFPLTPRPRGRPRSATASNPRPCPPPPTRSI